MPSPTIVLVHGAFGDASSWRPVYDRLAGDGHAVLAPPNPLRGLPYDASFTASVIDQIEGPVVLAGQAKGSRAVRTVVGAPFGSDQANQDVAPVQSKAVEALGLSHLEKVA